MFAPYSALLEAIDNQNLVLVSSFIQNNPELDYSHVCPNGLSALWWALMPHPDKNISYEIVEFLLNYTKNNGEPLLSPVQAFAGMTPYQYIRLLEKIKLYAIECLIANAERLYIAPPRANNQNLAGIAADTQNAHNSTVVALARKNIQRLYSHYIHSSAHRLDNATILKACNELQKLIELENDRDKRVQMKFGFNFCLNTKHTFAFVIEERSSQVEVNLTLAQLMTLNWLAAQETNAALLPPGANTNEGIVSRKKALLPIFYDIATAYGKNHASCAGGACNRLGMTLAAQHELVKSHEPGEPITGEMAQLISIRVFGEALARLSRHNPQRYWQCLAYLYYSRLSPEQESRAKEEYTAFITENTSLWLTVLIQHEFVDKTIAKKNIKSLSDTFPIIAHPLSYELTQLMPYMDDLLLNAFFAGTLDLEKGLQQAKLTLARQLLTNEYFKQTAIAQVLTLDDSSECLSLILSFISIWLERTRREGDVFLFSSLMTDKALEVNEEQFINDTLSLTLFYQRRETFKVQYPKQVAWLEALTTGNILTLLSSMSKERAANGDINLPYLITQALSSGLTANLVLDDMTFENLDLRGHDFSGIQLNHVTFNQCILPWAGDNIQCNELILRECLVPNINNTLDFPEQIELIFNNVCCLSHPPSNLITQFFLSGLDKLPEQKSKLDWSLRASAYNGYRDTVKAILASKRCSTTLLQQTDNTGQNALMYAVCEAHNDIVNMILNSEYCSKTLLEQVDHLGYNVLIMASLRDVDTLNAILNSQYCSITLIEHTSKGGDTALMKAVRFSNIDMVNAILNSDYYAKFHIKKIKIDRERVDPNVRPIIQSYLLKKIRNTFKDNKNILAVLNRLEVGAKSRRNPYWRKASLKLDEIVEALKDIHTTEELNKALEIKTSALSLAIDNRRLPSFFKAFIKSGPTRTRKKLTATIS